MQEDIKPAARYIFLRYDSHILEYSVDIDKLRSRVHNREDIMLKPTLFTG